MKQWKGLPIFIMGSAGTSREVRSAIIDINNVHQVDVYQVLGFVDDKREEQTKVINDLPVISEEDFFEEVKEHPLIGVIVPFGLPKLKMKIYEKITSIENVIFPNIIHPSVVIGENTSIGFGNVIAAGATISPNVSIGNFCLINNSCNIGHDTVIEDFVVINPLSAISGDVIIRKGALIGGHSAILQGVEIGEDSRVGLGAFVVKNISKNETVICEPAKVR